MQYIDNPKILRKNIDGSYSYTPDNRIKNYRAIGPK